MQKVKVSLRVKFSIIIIIFSTAILLYNFIVTGYSILNRNQSFLATVLLQDTVKLLDYFSSTVNDGLILDDDILLINTFDKIKKMENIDYAVLLDRNKSLRLHSETFAKQEFDPENEVLQKLSRLTNVTVYPEFNSQKIQSSYLISRAFYDNRNQYNGMLLVKYSTANLNHLITQIRDSFISNMRFILMTGIALAVLIGIILASWTLRPILTMVKGMEKVGKGDLDFAIQIKRNDELGYMSDNFNQMTKEIKQGHRLQIEQKKQEEQMQIAKSIQESIFPEEPLVETTYEVASFTVAAKTIGGDYNFYHKIDADHMYFTVADISGKGIPAALITFMLSTVLNAVVGKEKRWDAGYVMNEANRVIHSELMKMERFATAMFCFFDDREKSLNFVSAGHGDLYIYRNMKRKFEKAANIYLPLGIDDSVEYKSGKIKLYPNDMVVILSDGVSDAKNELGEDFGINKLFSNKAFYENLPATELVQRLKKDIFTYVGKAEQFDDMTLLIFKMKA